MPIGGRKEKDEMEPKDDITVNPSGQDLNRDLWQERWNKLRSSLERDADASVQMLTSAVHQRHWPAVGQQAIALYVQGAILSNIASLEQTECL